MFSDWIQPSHLIVVSSLVPTINLLTFLYISCCQSVMHSWLHRFLFRKGSFLHGFNCSDVWKWVKEPHLKWSPNPEWGALTDHLLQFADSSRRKHTLHCPTGRSLLYYTPRRKEDFLLAQQQPSQWELPPPWTLTLFQWTFILNSPHIFLLFSIKEFSPLLFSRLT